MRAGIGYDSHRFTDRRPLVLGGVVIPDTPGLEGHSDADAIAHAVTDAILGAAALGDIGSMFPDTDPANEGADSMAMLAAAVALLATHDREVRNIDVTVIAERPRIAPHAVPIREALAGVLRVGHAAVSVKGKSNEGMGWIGRGEGLAVIAVAAVSSRNPSPMDGD